jgi:hypothetical protein
MPVRRKAAPATPPPVRRGRKAANPADYAELAPTPYHKGFAKWLVEQTGYEPTNRKDFLKAVQFACDLRNGALGYNSVGNDEVEEEEAPVRKTVSRKGSASKATGAGAKTRRAAPVEEPEEEDWEEEEVDDEEEEFEDDADDAEEDDDDDDDDDDDWEDDEEEEEEEAAPAPKRRAPAKKSAPAKTSASSRTASARNAAKPTARKAASPAKKTTGTARRGKPSDKDFTF